MATTNTSIIGTLFATTLRILAMTNDTLLLTAPWIISPSTNPALQRCLPSPLVTSLAYAILEPLYTRLLLWLSLPYGFGLYVVASASFIIYTNAASTLEARTAAEEAQPADGETEPPSDSTAFAALFWPLQVTAASNAALLLIFRALPARSGSDLTNWSDVFSEECRLVFFYLWPRLYELVLTLCADRPLILGTRPGVRLEQLACLMVLFGTKLLARRALGLDGWMGLRVASLRQARELVDLERSRWFLDWCTWLGPASWWEGLAWSSFAVLAWLIVQRLRLRGWL